MAPSRNDLNCPGILVCSSPVRNFSLISSLFKICCNDSKIRTYLKVLFSFGSRIYSTSSTTLNLCRKYSLLLKADDSGPALSKAMLMGLNSCNSSNKDVTNCAINHTIILLQTWFNEVWMNADDTNCISSINSSIHLFETLCTSWFLIWLFQNRLEYEECASCVQRLSVSWVITFEVMANMCKIFSLCWKTLCPTHQACKGQGTLRFLCLTFHIPNVNANHSKFWKNMDTLSICMVMNDYGWRFHDGVYNVSKYHFW